MSKPETLSDIIAEMRSARTEFPFVYLRGEPSTPAKVDPQTNEIIEPQKFNIRRVTIKELAERLKAAHKREIGDCAKLREACEALVSEIGGYSADGLEVIWCGVSGETIKKVRAALAAPARNCDTPYNDRVEMYGAFKDWCNARGHTMEPKLAYDAFEWLLAPATEQEGGNDADK